MRQFASLPTYEEIMDRNQTNILENNNSKENLNAELKTEPPNYEEALLM